ncbi:MarR family winged helix-turn-helix transcriptional regulator [Brucellaceae bacterium C25G]
MPKPHYSPDFFGFLINDIARLHRMEMDRGIAAAGLNLTAGEARTLVYTARYEPVRQTVLADHMGVEAMTVSGYLDGLERLELIKRAADPLDRRAKLVELTENSIPVLSTIDNVSRGACEAVANLMEAEEWDKFTSQLKFIRENLTQRSRG